MGRQGGLLRGTPGGGVLRWSSCRAGMAMGMAGPDMAWRRRVALKRIGEDVHEPRTRGVPVGSGDHVKCNANRCPFGLVRRCRLRRWAGVCSSRAALVRTVLSLTLSKSN